MLVMSLEQRFQTGQINFAPNIFSYNLVLEAWARSSEESAAVRAMEVFRNLLKTERVRPDRFSFNQVLVSFSRSSIAGSARQAEQIANAVKVVKGAPAAVVMVYDEGTEGTDRADLALPESQRALVEAVAAANPNTIVLLHTGAPVELPWRGRVPAILQLWYPGQEGADAFDPLGREVLGVDDHHGRLSAARHRPSTWTTCQA